MTDLLDAAHRKLCQRDLNEATALAILSIATSLEYIVEQNAQFLALQRKRDARDTPVQLAYREYMELLLTNIHAQEQPA